MLMQFVALARRSEKYFYCRTKKRKLQAQERVVIKAENAECS